ncbi:hypothetical protein Bbelb_173030 [Branchiostoma belcheri]|nr:hypothetical protein Bbelb_173030 [Branchiostoma belcheri]
MSRTLRDNGTSVIVDFFRAQQVTVTTVMARMQQQHPGTEQTLFTRPSPSCSCARATSLLSARVTQTTAVLYHSQLGQVQVQLRTGTLQAFSAVLMGKTHLQSLVLAPNESACNAARSAPSYSYVNSPPPTLPHIRLLIQTCHRNFPKNHLRRSSRAALSPVLSYLHKDFVVLPRRREGKHESRLRNGWRGADTRRAVRSGSDTDIDPPFREPRP